MSSADDGLRALILTQRRELEVLARRLRELTARCDAAQEALASAREGLEAEREVARQDRAAAWSTDDSPPPTIATLLAAERRAHLCDDALAALEREVDACETRAGEAARAREDVRSSLEEARARLRATERRVEAVERERAQRVRRQKEAAVDDLSAARWYDSRRQDDDGGDPE